MKTALNHYLNGLLALTLLTGIGLSFLREDYLWLIAFLATFIKLALLILSKNHPR